MLTPYYSDSHATLYHGDCLEVLRGLPDCFVDAVVTDPPYDLTAGKKGGRGVASVNLDSPHGRSRIGTGNGAGGFMGKAWDATGVAFDPATWRECLRVLKPGGHMLAFGGSRTWHRLACAVEDAGFDIRDSIASRAAHTSSACSVIQWLNLTGHAQQSRHGATKPKPLNAAGAPRRPPRPACRSGSRTAYAPAASDPSPTSPSTWPDSTRTTPRRVSDHA